MSDAIGAAAMNLAFMLYLIHYLPQLVHNARQKTLHGVNLHFHGLLGLSYLADLSYGVGLQLPWQYRMVTLIGITCISIQHWQLSKVHLTTRLYQRYSFLLAGVSVGVFIGLFFAENQNLFLLMGYAAQAAALVYMLPVIVDNWRKKSALALDLAYLGLNWLCYATTLTAALCLSWPLPSKLGTLFGLTCISILISQRLRYHVLTRINQPFNSISL